MKYPKGYTKEEYIAKIKPYWEMFQTAEVKYNHQLGEIERLMSCEFGTEMELFWSDGYCGIGSVDRGVQLIHSYEMEK